MGALLGHFWHCPLTNRGASLGQVQSLVLSLNLSGALHDVHVLDSVLQNVGELQLTHVPAISRWGAVGGQLHFCSLES